VRFCCLLVCILRGRLFRPAYTRRLLRSGFVPTWNCARKLVIIPWKTLADLLAKAARPGCRVSDEVTADERLLAILVCRRTVRVRPNAFGHTCAENAAKSPAERSRAASVRLGQCRFASVTTAAPTAFPC